MIRCLRDLVSVKLQLFDTFGFKKESLRTPSYKEGLLLFSGYLGYKLNPMDPKSEFVPSFTQWLSLLTNVRLTYKHLKRALRVGFDVHLTSMLGLCAVHNRYLFILLIFSSNFIKKYDFRRTKTKICQRE